MIHLNDSKAPFGGRMDRHEHLGAGLIGVPALQRLLTDPRLAGVTYYLETPGMEEGYDAVNVDQICRRARMAKGSLYRHYRLASIAELLARVLRRTTPGGLAFTPR